jgi:type I restriction enzyme S subunit
LATLIPKEVTHPDYLRLALKRFPPSSLIKDPAYPAISLGEIEGFEIPVPKEYEDQTRIAHLLGKVEALITQRKQHLQQLDDLLKSVFLEMFGDPVSNEKGWEKATLEKLGSVNRGVSKHRPRNDPKLLGGKYPLIQTGDVSNAGTYITAYTQTYSDIGFAQSKLWPAGTLCITIAANIAQTGILTFDACFPDSVVGFVANKDEAHPLFIHGLFGFFQAILEKNAPAAAQKNINLEILRGLEVPKPPIANQNEFARVVEKIEALKNRYQHSLVDLEALYGALSQKAFKGQLVL